MRNQLQRVAQLTVQCKAGQKANIFEHKVQLTMLGMRLPCLHPLLTKSRCQLTNSGLGNIKEGAMHE